MDLTIWQAILIALATPLTLFFAAVVRDATDYIINWVLCLVMILCIVFAVVFVR